MLTIEKINKRAKSKFTQQRLIESMINLETKYQSKYVDTLHCSSLIYQKGDELKPHVDRPACEISVTCHIATKGEPWPIYMKALGKEPVAHYFEPGDACIYRGCEVAHWRETTENTDFNVQMMLHYVDKNGPNAEYKFDKRSNLGLNSFSRRS